MRGIGKWEASILQMIGRGRDVYARDSLIYLIYYSNAARNAAYKQQCTGWKIANNTTKRQHKTIVDLALIANQKSKTMHKPKKGLWIMPYHTKPYYTIPPKTKLFAKQRNSVT